MKKFKRNEARCQTQHFSGQRHSISALFRTATFNLSTFPDSHIQSQHFYGQCMVNLRGVPDSPQLTSVLSQTVQSQSPIWIICTLFSTLHIHYTVYVHCTLYSRLGQFVSKIWNWKCIQFVENSFYQKKWKGIKKKKCWHNWLANSHIFANICKLPVSNTFKEMHSKIW